MVSVHWAAGGLVERVGSEKACLIFDFTNIVPHFGFKLAVDRYIALCLHKADAEQGWLGGRRRGTMSGDEMAVEAHIFSAMASISVLLLKKRKAPSGLSMRLRGEGSRLGS